MLKSVKKDTAHQVGLPGPDPALPPDQGVANHSPWAKPTPWPVSVLLGSKNFSYFSSAVKHKHVIRDGDQMWFAKPKIFTVQTFTKENNICELPL